MSNLVVGQINARHSNVTWALLEKAILSNKCKGGAGCIARLGTSPSSIFQDGEMEGFQGFLCSRSKSLSYDLGAYGSESIST